MVAGTVNILFSSMSTGLREEGATVSKRVFNTPNASGESRYICEDATYNEVNLKEYTQIWVSGIQRQVLWPAALQSWEGWHQQSAWTVSSTYPHSLCDTAAGPGWTSPTPEWWWNKCYLKDGALLVLYINKEKYWYYTVNRTILKYLALINAVGGSII